MSDCPLYFARASARLGRQPGQRSARVGRLESRHQPLDVVRARAPSPAAGRNGPGPARVPAAANRRISRSATVVRTIGRLQTDRSSNIASTASGSVPTFASIAHQSRSGMWMSPASSLRASKARTIGSASRAGSRLAEQASWLRTSTSGSIAARRASAAATAGETSRCVADQPGRPEPHVGIGMLERLQARSLRPARRPGSSAQSDSRASWPGVLVLQPTLERRRDRGVLAIADQPQGRLARPLVGVGQPIDQLGSAQRGQVDGLDGRSVVPGLEAIDPPVGRVDLALVVAVVVDLAIVPVGDVERAVGAELDVHGPEPGVGRTTRPARRPGSGTTSRRAGPRSSRRG